MSEKFDAWLDYVKRFPEVVAKYLDDSGAMLSEPMPIPTTITPHVEKKKLIKVKVDLSIYKKAMEYNMNIEEYLTNQLVRRVNQISLNLAEEKVKREYYEYEQEQKIIRIIRRLIKTASKTGYVSQAIIVDEAMLERFPSFTEREVKNILDRLVEKKIIYQPVEWNYQIVKVKRKKHP